MAKINTAKFKEKGKALVMTGGEVFVVGGSMLLTKKFLDFNTLWKKSIEKDPKFAEHWWIKHQGGVKFLAGLGASVFIKNPWLRLIAIGFALCGFIEEVRVISTDDKGVSFFDAIGKGMGRNSTVTDQQLYEAALKAKGIAATNPYNEFPTNVGKTNPYNEFPTNVGKGGGFTDVLMPYGMTSVGYVYGGAGYKY